MPSIRQVHVFRFMASIYGAEGTPSVVGGAGSGGGVLELQPGTKLEGVLPCKCCEEG